MSDRAEEPSHSNAVAQPPGNTETKKSKASNLVPDTAKPSRYRNRQTEYSTRLDSLCGDGIWHLRDTISQKSNPKALKALISWVESARLYKIDITTLLGPSGYFHQLWKKKERKMTELTGVIEEAHKSMLEEHGRNIQGAADKTDGTALAKSTADFEGPKTAARRWARRCASRRRWRQTVQVTNNRGRLSSTV
ncbi:hypothetical protein F53441_10128 [Fusarium austroafricanum]|uniref:Uncharacterized protein n=1 Tax=Fusarium austroafricanum TaxID=2364996 RepID=A0A8H4K7I2_9HYPO|nr:hypothetical protein F53441_10128 [Fusarium austroafricanum]